MIVTYILLYALLSFQYQVNTKTKKNKQSVTCVKKVPILRERLKRALSVNLAHIKGEGAKHNVNCAL